MQVAGEEDEVKEFLREIRESVLGSHIRGETAREIAVPEDVSGFTIRH
jgi:hypothetical protein